MKRSTHLLGKKFGIQILWCLWMVLFSDNVSYAQELKFSIKNVLFIGNETIDDTELFSEIEFIFGREVTFAELELALSKVDQLYSQQGMLASVYFPPQDITDGQLFIKISEAKISDIIIDQKMTEMVPRSRISKIVEHHNPPGTSLNLKRVQRSIGLLNDLPGVRSEIAMDAGSAQNQVNLIVSGQKISPFASKLTLDNWGHASTGQIKKTVELVLNSPLKLADKISLNRVMSKGSGSTETKFELPIGYSGGRVTISALNLHYNLVDEFADLETAGASNERSAVFFHPYFYSSSAVVNGTIAFKFSNSHTASFGNTVSDKNIRTLNYNLEGMKANFGRDDSNLSWSIGVTHGLLDLSRNSEELDADNGGLRTNGLFYKANFSLNYSSVFAETWQAGLNLRGQFANKNLDSSQEFSLGGAQAIRSFPTSEASGDDGAVLKLEIKKNYPNIGIVSFFVEKGWIRRNKTPIVGNADGPNVYQINGLGVGLNKTISSNWSLNGSIARKIGFNPRPSEQPNGQLTDNDKSDTDYKLWLAIVGRF